MRALATFPPYPCLPPHLAGFMQPLIKLKVSPLDDLRLAASRLCRVLGVEVVPISETGA